MAVEGEKKKPNKLIVVIAILGAIIVLGIVALIFMATGLKISDITEKFVKQEEYVMQLDSFVVNLDTDGRTNNYLKTQISIMYSDDKKTSYLEKKTSQIRDVIIEDLMSYNPDELLESGGLEKAKTRLKTNINKTLGEETVEEIYFTDFLIQ
ncbi:flagellar basal body-associated FliL family protein [Alkalibacter mobilis]|uniref:flagellar basal body-associated FliL family protein n=1 Tax=Alkalibacter mobilis TaxID=2787712 RepID=UPI00189EA630|nr:flagellar basal body-associated FliL family protein [Alkalibacter mobilis]MBF7096312.1 flagellar basal body-associated FliL family protein [Alkalibacter mobilis]